MDEKVTGKRFLAVTLLNVLITIVEILGGILSGSLALLSDAFHNLGDSLSIVLGYFAQHIGGQPENRQRTYGYQRAEILSALTNSIFLIVISVFLIIYLFIYFLAAPRICGVPRTGIKPTPQQ